MSERTGKGPSDGFFHLIGGLLGGVSGINLKSKSQASPLGAYMASVCDARAWIFFLRDWETSKKFIFIAELFGLSVKLRHVPP